MKLSRSVSYLVVAVAYLLALGIAGVVYWQLMPFFPDAFAIVNLLIADTAGTVVIWAIGLIFKNSSVYDPYWSVIPPAAATLFVLTKTAAINVNDILFLIAVWVWAIRLTLNWAYAFHGMEHQDWRYTKLQTEMPKLWWFNNFFSIQYVPTLFVFSGMLPFYFIAANSGAALNLWTLVGAIVCIGAALLQLVGDTQMHRFRKRNAGTGKVIDHGLWRYTRHPNYLGEIAFWWGVFLMGIGLAPWWTVAGGLVITVMFALITAPMMEKHILQKYPAYADYQKRVSYLLILPRKNATAALPDEQVES